MISQTGIRYSQNTLTLKSKIARVKAGVRMPYFRFQDGTSIFQFLKDPCFKVIFFGDEGNDTMDDIVEEVLPLLKLTFSEIPQSVFRDNRNFYVMLRPDNHISYIGRDLIKWNSLKARISV